MKTSFANATTMAGVNGIMPPRWGLGFFANGVCYKHVAPLALGNPRRAITSNPTRI
jgi:hypothetical protein